MSYKSHQEWNLKEAKSVGSELKSNVTGDLMYSLVTVHLHYERRSKFYVMNLIFPNAIITVLTIVTFVLPEESGMICRYFFVILTIPMGENWPSEVSPLIGERLN